MFIKKLIRAILKIPATPFIVPYHLFLIAASQVVRVFEWVYETGDWDKTITLSIISDSKIALKNWFTTV